MKPIRSFFITLLAFSICMSASAESKTFDANGNESFEEFETQAIVLERTRIRAELEAVDKAGEFVAECDNDLQSDQARAVAGKILQIESSRGDSLENRYNSSLVATIDSDKISGALDDIDDLAKNQKIFRDRFDELESELIQILNVPAESRTREMLKKVSDNEKQLAYIRNFVPISWAESAGSGAKKNLFGYVENLTEGENGTLYFELKDPTSDAKIRCTLIARLNKNRPEFKKILLGKSPMYLYGMLTRFQGKVALMVWNVYL